VLLPASCRRAPGAQFPTSLTDDSWCAERPVCRCLLNPGMSTVVASPSHALRRRGCGGRELDAPTGTLRAGLCYVCFSWLALGLSRHWQSPFPFLQRASAALRAISRRLAGVILTMHAFVAFRANSALRINTSSDLSREHDGHSFPQNPIVLTSVIAPHEQCSVGAADMSDFNDDLRACFTLTPVVATRYSWVCSDRPFPARLGRWLLFGITFASTARSRTTFLWHVPIGALAPRAHTWLLGFLTRHPLVPAPLAPITCQSDLCHTFWYYTIVR
jgi:hypothetical protein